jgi:hypothetical protein
VPGVFWCLPGVVAIQAAAAGPNPPATWRIAATAVVLEQEAELRVVKKLKLVGTPIKVSTTVWGEGQAGGGGYAHG